MFYQDFQYTLDSFSILFNSPGEDKDIIQVHYYYSFSDKVPEDVVYHCLEDSQTISHFKKHHQEFKQTIVYIEDSLLLIFRLDVYVVETPVDVQFSKIFGSTELQHKFGDKGQRIPILYCYRVEGSVVLYQLERTILFFDEEHQGGHRQFGQVYPSGIQIFLQKNIQFLLLNRGKRVDLCRLGLRTWNKLYHMVPVTVLQ